MIEELKDIIVTDTLGIISRPLLISAAMCSSTWG